MKNAPKPFAPSALTLAALLLITGCGTSPLHKESVAALTEQVSEVKNEVFSKERAAEAAKHAAALMVPTAPLDMPKPLQAGAGLPRFDVDATNAAPFPVFERILEGSGLTLALSQDAEDSLVSIRLRDATWKDALDTLRDTRGYEYRLDGRRVIISKPTMLAKHFDVNYLANIRNGSSSVKVGSGGASSGGLTTRAREGGVSENEGSSAGVGSSNSSVQSSNKEDFWGDLKGNLKEIANGKDNVITVNEMAGSVFVRAEPAKVREIDAFLSRLEASVGRQVMIEAKIIEVTLNDDHQEGVNWSAFGGGGHSSYGGGFLPSAGNISPGAASLTIPTGAGNASAGALTFQPGSMELSGLPFGSGAGIAFKTLNFAAMINFLETQGSVHVLSSPRVAAMNNRKALLKIGSDDYYATGVSSTTLTSAVGASSSPTVQTEKIFSGISLDVLAQIAQDGSVILNGHPQVSEVTQKTISVNLGTQGTVAYPTASNSINETDFMVKLDSGSIAVIGGLMRYQGVSNGSKTPGLSDLPGIGALAKNSGSSGRKTEVIILIKATVIKTNADWAAGLSGMSSMGDRK